MNPNEGKLKALQAAMAKIEKDFGKGSIMKLGDEHVENIEVIPTGSIALDNALDNNYEQKYIFNFALHQQTEGEGRRNSQHTLPHLC